MKTPVVNVAAPRPRLGKADQSKRHKKQIRGNTLGVRFSEGDLGNLATLQRYLEYQQKAPVSAAEAIRRAIEARAGYLRRNKLVPAYPSNPDSSRPGRPA